MLLAGGGIWAWRHVSAFEESMARVYDIPIPQVALSKDPEVLARGEHLAGALGGCVACHGENLAGGKVEDLGPIGRIVHGNLTPGKNSLLAGYSDGELVRLLRHGVKRNGKSAYLMPVMEIFWWPDADRIALASYLRSLEPIDGPPLEIEFSAMAKVLDRLDSIPIDSARRVDHAAAPSARQPEPTKEYGELVAHMCRGCHGEKHLAGGPIPGSPPDMAPPLNLTPHETGLAGWTYDDFETLIATGNRKNGKKMDDFMPVIALRNMNETERRALWAYLQSLPPVPYGER